MSVPLAANDLAERRLPNRLIFPTYPTLLILFGVAAVVEHQPAAFVRSLVAMLALLVFYGAPYLARTGLISGGDVKLSGLLGLAMGWAGWRVVLTGTFLCWVLALACWVVPAVLLATFRSADRVTSGSSSVPLGPFLIGGALIAVFLNSWL
ncbi:prepilin peptidase [Actinokineospora sp. NBRC 105648]|uniref:prepilin peptidase n=1 Tax=Actinokineospora sp. NBRC 105648 TaxID=3032206 RepID=UPI0025523397|nr:prepilin peptidase [Actinokineospora sp. NBRC 105648]